MRHPFSRRAFGILATALACGVLAPAAGAAVTPAISLDQSAGHTAGSSVNLGLDLKFSDTGADSPHHLTINLPPGLLANAALDGGGCLKSAQVTGTSCEVGSGTVSAAPVVAGLVNLGIPVSVPVTFYLVPPPAPGDLAGLAVEGLGEQLGSTGDVSIRPSGDPGGVGVTLALALPNELPLTLPVVGSVNLTPIALTEINSTFDQLRYPTSCPSTPAQLTATVDSYSDPTLHTVSAPLSVTGCAGLAYAPAFKVSATRDSTDRQVRLQTALTQTAAEAPSRSISLAFPSATIAPNLESITMLCQHLTAGGCPTVGSVTASSPLYPTPLSGQAYLTGSSSGLALTLVFPAPFPLTLSGAVDLVHNSASFTGLPDIPLTNLAVTLNGGTGGLFLSTCASPTGTANATVTDQNGDRTLVVPDRFTVSGCSSTGSGAAGSGTSGGTTTSRNGAVSVTRPSATGVGTGHTALRFTVRVRRGAAKLTALTVGLPHGLRFTRALRAVRLSGARIRSLRLSGGRLVIALRHAVSRVTVSIGAPATATSQALKAHPPRRLVLRIATTDTRRHHVVLRVSVPSSPSA